MSMLANLRKIEDTQDLGGGKAFKVKDGNNIIRVLTEGVYHESEYQGKKTFKFVMFVIDRKDGAVKPYFAPYTVYKAIAALEEDPFFKFEGMPMPYDINIKATNAGKMEVEYNVQASPNKTELTADEVAAATKAGTVQEYLSKLKQQDGEVASQKLTPADIVAKASGGKFVPKAQPNMDVAAKQEAPDFLQ